MSDWEDKYAKQNRAEAADRLAQAARSNREEARRRYTESRDSESVFWQMASLGAVPAAILIFIAGIAGALLVAPLAHVIYEPGVNVMRRLLQFALSFVLVFILGCSVSIFRGIYVGYYTSTWYRDPAKPMEIGERALRFVLGVFAVLFCIVVPIVGSFAVWRAMDPQGEALEAALSRGAQPKPRRVAPLEFKASMRGQEKIDPSQPSELQKQADNPDRPIVRLTSGALRASLNARWPQRNGNAGEAPAAATRLVESVRTGTSSRIPAQQPTTIRSLTISNRACWPTKSL